MFGHSDKMVLHGHEGRKTQSWLQNWQQLLLAVTTSCESKEMKWWHNPWTGCYFLCVACQWELPTEKEHNTKEPKLSNLFLFKILFFFFDILFTHSATKRPAQQGLFFGLAKAFNRLLVFAHIHTFSYRHTYNLQHNILGSTTSFIVFFLTLPESWHDFLKRGQECVWGDTWVVLQTL